MLDVRPRIANRRALKLLDRTRITVLPANDSFQRMLNAGEDNSGRAHRDSKSPIVDFSQHDNSANLAEGVFQKTV